jgi:beta-glucosidase
VYAGLPASTGEPPKRLVGWSKVKLGSGESKEVTVDVDQQFLSVFDEQQDSWKLIPGDYVFSVGGSSRSLPLTQSMHIE